MTNDELDAIAQTLFTDAIESTTFDVLDAHDRTLVMAKLAALAATYAGDERNF